jgi:hypothetical protein
MSPLFKEENGFAFRIFSNEENRMHIHVLKDNNEAKIWLEPDIKIEYNNGFKLQEIKKVLLIVKENEEEFKQKYREYIR